MSAQEVQQQEAQQRVALWQGACLRVALKRPSPALPAWPSVAWPRLAPWRVSFSSATHRSKEREQTLANMIAIPLALPTLLGLASCVALRHTSSFLPMHKPGPTPAARAFPFFSHPFSHGKTCSLRHNAHSRNAAAHLHHPAAVVQWIERAPPKR